MDPVRFDTLTKTLSTPETRRGALGGLLAGTLSLLGLVDGAAKKRHTLSSEGPCGDGSGNANKCRKDKDCCTRVCKRGRCRCKKLGEGCRDDRSCCASFGQALTCVNQTCQMVQAVQTSPPPAPTCTDGVQNQGETDIDCGGECPRCATGQTCASRNDCADAFCRGGRCQICEGDANCFHDGRGRDDEPDNVGVCECVSGRCSGQDPNGASSCAACPEDTSYCVPLSANSVLCFPLCGAT
jgi:hypothetical protein